MRRRASGNVVVRILEDAKTGDSMNFKGKWRAAAAVCLLASASIGLLPLEPAQAQPTRPNSEASLFPVRVVANEGKILLTLPRPDGDGVSARILYATSLRTGLGSAELRLDRGMLGPERVLAFRRIGRKVAATFENQRFRASGDPGVEKGGRESFPFTTAAMLDIAAEQPDGSLVVDIAPFLTRDEIDIAGALNSEGKGFRLVDALSAADPTSVKVFPDNIEMEAVQTYVSDSPGRQVRQIADEPRQLSFTVHHSFIRLPDSGFKPRKFDIRAASFGTQYFDFATPLGQDVVQQFANRFRLEKIDPSAPRSKEKKPIIFYIDPAAPEPIRKALLDGVNYWKPAFEAAGFIDAFEARILPPGADPLDVRYNMVNWSNRLTRGWSYGGGITDPRTGEIIKGNVVIGALRVRQNMTIFEGLVGVAENNSGSANDPVRVSLSRIRQLGAHEVGHALGFMHNFSGSTQDRSTVMEYPGPRIALTNGRIDLSDAYKEGGGAWDAFTVDWLYGDPAPGVDADAAALDKALAAQSAGLRYIAEGGRGPEGLNPWSSMWDDGPDPVASLEHMMEVRRVALANFGTHVLHPNEPIAVLRRKFVPIWLLHRYNVDAAGKAIGGISYEYNVAGDGRPFASLAPAEMQRASLRALLKTLSTDTLTVPERLVMPLSSGSNDRNPQETQELFQGAGYSAFDPLVAADVAAQLTLNSLLAPTRLTRVYEQHRRTPSLPGLDELLDGLTEATIEARRDAVGRRISYRTLMTLARVAQSAETSPDVAAILSDRLQALRARLAKGGSGEDGAWSRSMARILGDDDLLSKELSKKPAEPAIPPGMPIGSGPEFDWFGDM